MIADALLAKLAELRESDSLESMGDVHFAPLVTLESGARYGLALTAADEAVWAVALGDEMWRFGAGEERRFVELLEHDRRELDDQLMAGAAELGLPGEAVLVALPAVGLARFTLATGSAHYTRVTLPWLLASELRDLRKELQAVADDSGLPPAVRSLAARLVVPE